MEKEIDGLNGRDGRVNCGMPLNLLVPVSMSPSFSRHLVAGGFPCYSV